MRARASKKARLTEVKTPVDTRTGLETDSAQKLWDEHISQRKPKLFHSQFKSGNWNTNAWLESFPEYLKEQAVGAKIPPLFNGTSSCAVVGFILDKRVEQLRWMSLWHAG